MILYRTKFLTLKAYKRENKPDWVYAVRENAKDIVVILPLIKKPTGDEILFLITKRPPLQAEGVAEFSVEIPAGLLGDENPDETPKEAIKRELMEETGFLASSFKIYSKKVSSTGGLTSETSIIAIATVLDSTPVYEADDDNGVIIERVCVKKEEVKEFLKECENKGYAISAQTLAALYYMETEEL